MKNFIIKNWHWLALGAAVGYYIWKRQQDKDKNAPSNNTYTAPNTSGSASGSTSSSSGTQTGGSLSGSALSGAAAGASGLNYDKMLFRGVSAPAEVRSLQSGLGVSADGNFGPATEAALLAQKGVTQTTLRNFYGSAAVLASQTATAAASSSASDWADWINWFNSIF